MEQRVLRLSFPLDLSLTLRGLAHGAGDPTMKVSPRSVLRATRTPEGPGTEEISLSGNRVEVRAWGPGATWLLEHAPDLLGFHDDPSAFRPTDAVVAGLHRAARGLRLGRSLAVFETMLPTILEQKIAGAAARRSYRDLVRKYGTPAPGDKGLLLQPSPEELASLAYYDFHPLGVERKRAEVIRNAAAHAPHLERLTEESKRADKTLRSLPGIGPWTSAIVRALALGDPDAVEVGDFHLPNIVAWVLAGEPRGDDARMLELLEPYRGQRARVLRLLETSGMQAPRYGPRRRLSPIAKI